MKTKFHTTCGVLATAVLLAAAIPSPAAEPPPPAVRDALAPGLLGLYPASRFKLAAGGCKDCAAPPQALWYFRDDLVAVARDDAAGFTPRRRVQDDVAGWLAANGGRPRDQVPPLLWIGSPQVAEGRLQPDARLTRGDGTSLPIALAPRLSTNRSYADASSMAYFGGGEVRARGAWRDGRFVVRTLWPHAYALAAAAPSKPLAAGESIESLVRAGQGGATSAFASRTLWRSDQRDPERREQPLPLAGKPVLAFMLNGAQGDDDESYGGHFAVATGRFGAAGEWGDWLVNNFYSLASVSEKGILASMLPMDAYMGDLNSGQAWYRPSYMLVAVLRDQRAPALYQEAISRVFHHFYRQDFHYRHASVNCAGINVETLRTLGWEIPRLGGESPLKAALALPYMALKDVSLASGQSAYDYLQTERTELLPFVAFNTIANDLLARLSTPLKVGGTLETQLSEDLEALLLVRIPQFPSSRAFGHDPVLSLREYERRAPANRADWKIVPVAPRAFPAAFRDAAAPQEPEPPSAAATRLWFGGGFIVAAIIGAWLFARLRRAQAAP